MKVEIMSEQVVSLEAQVDELQTIIGFLKYKIDNYEEVLVKCELEQRNKKLQEGI